MKKNRLKPEKTILNRSRLVEKRKGHQPHLFNRFP